MRPRPHACPAALAFMAEGPHDVRPALVALYYADDLSCLPHVLAYGLHYLAAWSERNGQGISYPLNRCVVAHGLLRLWRPSAALRTKERAREAGIREARFRTLSNVILSAYKARLTEGAVRFLQVAANSEDPARPPLQMPWQPETTWWSRKEAGVRNECRLLRLDVGTSDRSPASEPRELRRDIPQQQNLDWAA